MCADPENLPFSNQKRDGFENRIADLIARDLGAKPSYIWWGQRVGFIRNTMNATLNEGRCDIVIGVPRQYDLVRTTTPYYRSTYVFVYPKGKGIAVTSLDDPILRKLKVGVHLLGADYHEPAARPRALQARPRQQRRRLQHVLLGEQSAERHCRRRGGRPHRHRDRLGPAAGYFAKRQSVPLAIVPVPSGKGDLPLAFDISMGVKRGQDALHARLERILMTRRAAIRNVLREYNVPMVDRP